jgi:hypothetical protein
MNNKKPEDVVFETAATCTVLVAGAAFGALLYHVITAAVPLLTSMVPQLLMVTGL